MRLDVGGSVKKPDWITIDQNKDADLIHDLDVFPYPLEPNSVEEMRMFHCLEHLREPLQVMEELYRIAKEGCIIHIKIPYWKLDHPIRNPAHRHAFPPEWFKNLNPDSNVWERNMRHLCKVNWAFVKEKKSRGKHNKMKVYEYEIWLIKKGI